MYQQVFHWVGGMKFQHEILIPWAGSELGRLFGFFDDHPGDVIVRSSVHVTNSNWTKKPTSNFLIWALPLWSRQLKWQY